MSMLIKNNYKYAAYFISALIFCSCNEKKMNSDNKGVINLIDTLPKSPEEDVDTKRTKKPKNLFYNNEGCNYFDFHALPLSNEVHDIPNNETSNYNIDSSIAELLRSKENYYKLINYCLISDNETYKTIAVFGNYDYYTNILLLTINKNGVLIDYKIIASLMGDADSFIEIKSKILSSDTIELTREFKEIDEDGKYNLIKSSKEFFTIDSNGSIISSSAPSPRPL